VTRVMGLPLLSGLGAGAAGVLVGVAYTLSPTTVWFLLLMLVVFAWARQGLGPREQRWVMGLLGTALITRVAALVAVFLLADRSRDPFAILFIDERLMISRSMWMLEFALGKELAPDDRIGWYGLYGRSGLQDILAYWQLWFGPAPYGVRLLNVAMWLTGAVVLHRTARCSFGPLPALGGLGLVLFMPTLFVWSVSALKEAPSFFLTAVVIASAVAVVRGTRRSDRVLAAVLLVVAVATISTMRNTSLFVTSGGLGFAAAGWLLTRRAWVCATVLAVAVGVTPWAARLPAAEHLLMQQFRQAAAYHFTNVSVEGYSYKLLDEEYYDPKHDAGIDFSLLKPDEAARFALRGVTHFLTAPVPWNVVSTPALAFLPQQVAWYILAALAVVGVGAGFRRDRALTWLLVGNALVGSVTVALFGGNEGTFVRMRDSVVPVIVWLSALGGSVVLEWYARYFSQGATHANAR